MGSGQMANHAQAMVHVSAMVYVAGICTPIQAHAHISYCLGCSGLGGGLMVTVPDSRNFGKHTYSMAIT